MARALAAAGAKVAVLDLKLAAAEQVAAGIRAAGGTARAFEANVLERPSLEAAAQAVLDHFGPCDILVNGAGGNHPKGTTSKDNLQLEDFLRPDPAEASFFDLDEAGMRFVFDLNLLGTVVPCQVFARQMVGRQGCCILNLSSMNSFRPLTRIPAYSAAKAAVSNFTQWLAVHFAPVGSGSTPSRPVSSSPSRTARCCSAPAASPRPGPPRSSPRPPWPASGNPGPDRHAALAHLGSGGRVRQRHRRAGGRRVSAYSGV